MTGTRAAEVVAGEEEQPLQFQAILSDNILYYFCGNKICFPLFIYDV